MSDIDDENGKSGPRAKTTANVLDDLVREAKEDLVPPASATTHGAPPAFAAIEDRILARMAKERSPFVREVDAPGSRDRRARTLRLAVAVLAAAAAIALVMKRDPAVAVDRSVTAQAELTAGSLRAAEGGEVRVGGVPASAGQALRAGDVIEVGSARAVLERPHKVTWLLEAGGNVVNPAGSAIARARVKSAGESLVLGLEDGVIEAQVTPVPSGEAFAVDVAAGSSLVRVAVHGTHLRVARTGSRVVIDLTEGVVSIGVPPRTGSTYGTLVTAPSHVEFDAANLDATLRIDHTPAAVRAPVPLAPSQSAQAALGTRENAVAAARTDLPSTPPQTPEGPALSTIGAATVPRPLAVPRPADLPRDPSRVETKAEIDPTKPVLPPREAIAAAVRDCAAARSRPENVRVTVSSSLKLKIAAGGAVETAQFDPPLLPEIQTCAATAIYKAKLEDASGATVMIPINFSY